MLDRQFENRTFPELLPLHRFKRPLVLAPHPDDEVFGCGGLMATWSRLGVQAQVVVLTHGEAQDAGQDRKAESLAAAAILGNATTFWDFPDRGIRCSEALVARLANFIETSGFDIVFCPALHEPHPDHQATALAVLWCLGRLKQPVEVCFYESGDALVHCTHVVNITPVASLKDQALGAFVSQESAQPYRSRIAARDHFRAMSLGPDALAAEGFQWLPLPSQGWPALIPALDPLFLHSRHQAVLPEDLPLVSVLVRTVGDPMLEQAVASVRAQTYPCIELVVVAAHGVHDAPPWLQTSSSPGTKWVCPGGKRNRPEAANAALDAANGRYCLFLDDDDLIAPGHIEKLVDRLRSSPLACAAHTDTQVINHEGVEILRYEKPYSAQRLACTNIFPIHSVLFTRDLATLHGCRFDESLPVLEDWDFWLQVSEHTEFLHIPGLSAVYRYRDRSQLVSDTLHSHHHRHWRHQVSRKWLTRLPADRISEAMAWHAEHLDHCEQQLEFSKKTHACAIDELQRQLASTEASLSYVQQQLTQCSTERDTALQALASIYASRSWKLLDPLRWLKRKLHGTAS